MISAGGTDIGRKRKVNQDSILLDDKQLLYLVADGMGGHKGGDKASQMAVALFAEQVRSNIDIPPKDILKQSILHVNQKILETSQADPELKGMGTTVVSILFKDSSLYFGNVGDSRAYMVNSKSLYQMTKDHSLVQEKINMGIYTREEGRKDKQKNVLVRTVGFEANIEVDVYSYKVNKNDLFMLCSDGLYGKVSDHDILFIINENIPSPATATKKDLEVTVQKLIDLANENGGSDNISVIIALAQ